MNETTRRGHTWLRDLTRGRDALGQTGPEAGPKVKRAAHRAALTMADQGFSSVSNFAVGVVAARIGGARGLGGFAFAYVCWQLLAALHRAVVTEPMAIENDAWRTDAAQRVRAGLAAEIMLGICAVVLFGLLTAVLWLAGERTFATALLAMLPWLPCLVVQDYWRWVGFMQRRPGKALANDAVFNVIFGLAICVLVLSRSHSIVAVIASWGAGAFAGALFGLGQNATLPSLRGGIVTLRARPHLSKWLAAESTASWGASQAVALVVGFILGPVGLGFLRAAQTLVYGPTQVLIQAGGSIGLPESTLALEEHGWKGLQRVTRLVTAAGLLSVGLVGAIVAIFGRELLSLLYGEAFGHYWLTADLFAIGMVVSAFALGAILILKATRNTRRLFNVSLVNLATALTAAAALTAAFGVVGAAAASIVRGTISLVGFLYCKRRAQASFSGTGAAMASDNLPAGGYRQPTASELG